MIPIQPNQLAGLEWRQPSAFNRTYELKTGDSVLARLEFKKVFGTLAAAQTASQSWTFKRGGFLMPIVTARMEGSEVDIATFEPNWTQRKGTLTLAGGETLELRSSNFWASEWVLSGAQKDEILRFHNKGMLHHGASVDVSESAKSRNDLGLLLALTWYILVLHMQDSAVVASS